MKKEWVTYRSKECTHWGYLAYRDTPKEKAPAVLIAHAWRGQDEFARKKAEFMAELGYVGFAADLYGNGTIAQDDTEAAACMLPLFLDRKTLRARILAAYDAVRTVPGVDPERIAAIGFCFGGATVIELLRSGAPIKGTVSIHGLLGYTLGSNQAVPEPRHPRLHGSALLLHGYQDPLVTQQDIVEIQREFSEAGVDWQMHIYGRASHAFTNPLAHDLKNGLIYDPLTEQRALRALENFLAEIF